MTTGLLSPFARKHDIKKMYQYKVLRSPGPFLSNHVFSRFKFRHHARGRPLGRHNNKGKVIDDDSNSGGGGG